MFDDAILNLPFFRPEEDDGTEARLRASVGVFWCPRQIVREVRRYVKDAYVGEVDAETKIADLCLATLVESCYGWYRVGEVFDA